MVKLFYVFIVVLVLVSCGEKEQETEVSEVSKAVQYNDPFQLYDLHVHLKGDLTIEEALTKSEKDQVKYGIAINCGLGFPIESDEDIEEFLVQMEKYPQFYMAMQAEGREWVDMFSEEARLKFDYVFTDAMTFIDKKSRRNRIWIPEETWVDDEQEFMDHLVSTIVEIMNNEPIDLYVNSTYLPDEINDKYDELWTEQRMDEVISAAVSNDIAIEISNRFKIPSAPFIKRAKAAGVKFTSGTNNIDKNFTRPDYTIEMIEECGLTEEDFWLPGK